MNNTLARAGRLTARPSLFLPLTNAEDHVRGRCDLLNLTTDVIERLVGLSQEDADTIRQLRTNLARLVVGQAKGKAPENDELP